MIPRRIYWMLDTLMVAVAFAAAEAAAPVLLRLLGDSGLLALPPLQMLSPADPYGATPFPPRSEILWMLPLMIVATLGTMEALDGYRAPAKQSLAGVVLSSVIAVLIGLGLTALGPFALRDPRWSRLFVAVFAGCTLTLLVGYRLSLRTYRLRRAAAGAYAKHLAFVGEPSAITSVMNYIRPRLDPRAILLEGFFETRDGVALEPLVVGDQTLRPLGHVRDLRDALVHQPVDELITLQTDAGSPWLPDLIDACDYFRVSVRIVPLALLVGQLRDLHYVYRGDPYALPEVVLKPARLDSDTQFIKRLLDVVGSGVLLVLLSPLFLVIALAIKLTTPRLPVFYPWRVVGLHGRSFTGYKFTTMTADADARRGELAALNEMRGPVFKIRNDPRMTPLGRILRKYSLNELPQLWSVFKGDMSLVGPRPAFPHELRRYELWHKRKLCVRPGMTCLWQVRGRNRVNNFDEWVRMDLEYIDNWSLWLDCKILLRTAWAVVAGTGS